MQPNNTNTNDNVYGVVIMARHYESSPGSFHEWRLSMHGCQPSNQATW